MSEILQPCPFCGGTNICTEKGINLNYCDSCSAEANIEHWNNRPIEDALRARIAELEAERRWIPVSSGEFPKSGSAVLVQILEGQGIDLVFFRSHKFCTFAGTTVTHWMPLPEPPEVKE